MSKRLDQDERDLILTLMKLIERSEDIGDGWREVSGGLRNQIAKQAAKNPDLFDVDNGKTLRIRLSKAGQIVRCYI